MIVEYIGLPGSGKTTSMYTIINTNPSNVIVTREYLDNIKLSKLDYLFFISNSYCLVTNMYLGVLYNIEFKFKRWYTLFNGVNKTLNQYAKIYYVIKHNPCSNFILDEGLLQRSISIYCFNKTKINMFLFKKQLEIIKKMQLIDEIRYLNVSIDKAIERCNGRPGGLPYRYSLLNIDSLKEKFHNNIEGFEIIKNTFKEKMMIDEFR